MEKPDHQSHLPKVEQDDILSLVLEDIHDKHHRERWERFLASNPTLANEIQRRADIESTQSAYFDENRVQFQERITSTVSFAISALERATERKRGITPEAEQPTIVDVDGEDQPLSA